MNSNRPTQTESLKKTRSYSGIVREQVYDAIATAKAPLTRTEIGQQLTDLKMGSITARVHELLTLGRIRVVGQKWDAETKRRVQTVAIAAPTTHAQDVTAQ